MRRNISHVYDHENQRSNSFPTPGKPVIWGSIALWLFTFLLFTCELYAREEYRVSYAIIQDTLTAKDDYDPEFGRFDVFEFNLSTGDVVDIEVRASGFQPTLAIVSPAKKVEYGTPEKLTRAHFHGTVSENGTYLVIVRGDSLATGVYQLRCRYAAAPALQPSDDADLCEEIVFLLAHLRADFYFLKKPPLPGQSHDEWEPTMVLQNALSARIVHPGAEKYVARMYQGNNHHRAENIFNTLVGKYKFCLGDGWELTNSDWKVVNPLIPYRRKSVVFTEKNNDASRIIRFLFTDYSGTTGVSSTTYVVEIEFDRK